MPRVLIYASRKWGGLGLLSLPTEQGVSQCAILISHLRGEKYLSKPIITLIESYKMNTGMTTNILEDTAAKTYVTAPWLDSLRTFLRVSQAQIRLLNIQKLHLLRANDHPIMKNNNKNLFTKSELESINACRLFPASQNNGRNNKRQRNPYSG
jgi:hypothetical protein